MKKYVLYGATGGVGEEVARRLKQSGHQLHLVARNHERLQTLARELDATYTAGDVCDDSLFEQVTKDCEGPISGLLYGIGTINLRPFPRLTQNDFLNDFQINVVGAARAIQSALPSLKMSESSSSVVLFSSVAADVGFSFHASISMAKGAINALTRALAAELAPSVRVNAIAPSLTHTPLTETLFSNEKMIAKITEAHPMKRLGTVDDLANMAEYLLSDHAGWITGQIFAVDGGRSTLCI